MTDCQICKKPIVAGTPGVSIVGGMFPVEDPDFFMVEETILRESHAHLDCLLRTMELYLQYRREHPT